MKRGRETTGGRPSRWPGRRWYWSGSCKVATDEFVARRQAVAAGLAERKIDALLVAFSPNLRYLTGFTGSNGNLLLLPDRAIVFTDPRYQLQARQETTGGR